MKTAFYNHLIPALLAAIVFFTTLPFIESTMRIYSANSAAIEWKGVEVKTPVVRPGEVLWLVYTLRVNKQCPSDQRGFMLDASKAPVVSFPIGVGGFSAPSAEWREVPFKVAIPLEADKGRPPFQTGKYIYRSTSTRYCHDGVEQDVNIPEAQFQLEVP